MQACGRWPKRPYLHPASAAGRARPMPDRLGAAALASWSCCRGVLVRAEGPDAASGAWAAARSWVGPGWSSEASQKTEALPVLGFRHPAALLRPQRRRAACAPARSPWLGTRTGRQDTTVVIVDGARAIPAWSSRW
jgi:hypothetical protein